MIDLNDKTVVLAGPFGLLQQNLIARIAESGADVAVITDDVKGASRVCQNIMDMREVSEKYGRASAVELNIKDAKTAENTFSRSAEIFGGIDIYIDTHLFSLNVPFFMNQNIPNFDEDFGTALTKIKYMTKTAADFLKSRTRGRILYLFNELDIWTADKTNSDVFADFTDFLRQTSLNLAAQNTAVNALAVGVNEEYLLTRLGKTKTIQQNMKEFLNSVPHAKLVDYTEIANVTTFIVSSLSSGINGQVIRVDHGI